MAFSESLGRPFSKMKVGRYLAFFVLIIGFLIAFGNRGLVDNYMMRERLATLKKANQEIARENKGLRKTIMLLKIVGTC